ncbi:Protein of unknown function [Rubritalea squalenifaciens DSM 18772]|uniref:Tat (Twin-arginine translocation) pathway signal sequence n=2 Tax=Rubritalea TaxID=361050 RepID=A0A1M6PQF0_9BACT|nr:DUF1501 domain-containing protein [Rubritalea squalenifaciens]SHK10200.1 Protein of unknown function [Rubritalea squalenifaciens DSM 18772]
MNEHTNMDDLMGLTRRHFFKKAAAGIGGMALSSLLPSFGKDELPVDLSSIAHYAPKAKRIIYLCQSGGPSHIDLFDDKPLLREKNGEQLPDSVRSGQRLTGMSANQSSIPLAGSHFDFKQYGQSGNAFSSLLPHTASVADDLCIIRSMYTEAINHDPAITFLQTGSQISGRPSLGSWISYGLGSLNENLPSFIVLVSAGQGGQPLYSRLWGSGFLDSRYQGVRFRAGKEPVLYLTNPEGVSPVSRRGMLDKLNALNKLQFEKELDPEIESRIAQYEMAYRMQTSVPEVTDLSDEPESIFELYGEDSKKPGTYAANCLQARRLAERGVRFIQLYHQGWDQHGNLPAAIRNQCKETDQASAALIKDLKQRGMLDETLVIWGGEFGRTAYSQGKLTKNDYGRDHHPRCFTMWLAGGGIKPGITFGRTDDYGYNIVDAAGNPINPTKHHYHPDAVHVHDLQATILHLMGINHEHLTYKYQGRRFRLTDVHGHVVKPILA